jgi:hypothetical protein
MSGLIQARGRAGPGAPRRPRACPTQTLTASGTGFLYLLIALILTASSLPAATYYVTVTGLGGESDYEQHFAMWAKDIEKAVKSGPDSRVETLVNATREQVRGALDRIAKQAKPTDALVLMLIGHGSFDGYEYKINLPGPDLTASELATLLDRIPASRHSS